MKLLFDFLPVLLFFIAYKFSGIYVATGVAMVAVVLQSGWLWLRNRKLETSQLAVLILIVVLGALTLVFNNPDFIKWKPTLVNWMFGIALAGSMVVSERNLLQRLLDEKITLPSTVWRRLSLAWTGFFLFSGALNLFVAYRFSLDTWVNFKLYGLLGLTLIFAVLQALYIARHLPEETEPSNKEN